MNYTKTCSVCQETFPATTEYFHKKIGGKYGVTTKCKLCVLPYNRSMYTKHKHKILEYKRIENIEKAEEMKNRRHKQYIKHKKQRLIDVKNYQLKNKKTIRKKRAEYTINRYNTNPSFKIKMTLSRRMRGLINKNGIKTVDLIGCSIDYLKIHLQSKFTNGMNWNNYGRYGWHIDHILPCASFDLTDPEQQKKCFHYTNLQPLWAVDNIRKSDKVLDTHK
jgi:hypothetical protein